MDIENFITLFKEQFDFMDDNVVISEETAIRDLEDWDSLVALSVIAMIDENYSVSISGDDIRNSNSIKDLHDLVAERKTK